MKQILIHQLPNEPLQVCGIPLVVVVQVGHEGRGGAADADTTVIDVPDDGGADKGTDKGGEKELSLRDNYNVSPAVSSIGDSNGTPTYPAIVAIGDSITDNN